MKANFLNPQSIKPFFYYRHVDNTFAIFGSEEECTSFLDALNSVHSTLEFMFEKEENDELPFLDILVEETNEEFITCFQQALFYWKMLLLEFVWAYKM